MVCRLAVQLFVSTEKSTGLQMCAQKHEAKIWEKMGRDGRRLMTQIEQDGAGLGVALSDLHHAHEGSKARGGMEEHESRSRSRS